MMRFLLIALCAARAYFYWKGSIDTSNVPGFKDLGVALERVRTSVPWPGKAAEDALEVELTRSAALDRDVKRLSAMLAQAEAEKAARDADLGSSRAASQSSAAEFQKQRQRADTRTAQLGTQGEGLDARAARLQEQLENEKARSARSERDVAAAREQFARAAADKAAAVDLAQRSLHDAARISDQQSQEEHRRADMLAKALAALQQTAASSIDTLQKQLEDERARSATLVRAEPAQPVRDESICAGTGVKPEATTGATFRGNDRFPLPDGMPTQVVVRYSRDSESARAHAKALSQLLQAQGVTIVNLVNDRKSIEANSMIYFYKDDRGSAARLTEALPEFQFKVYRSTPPDTIPRPGIIEIAVAA